MNTEPFQWASANGQIVAGRSPEAVELFISWAGERSRSIGEALRQIIGDILQNVKPWMSLKDLEKGARWASEIQVHLREANLGIVCITPEALQSSWLLFEAGALSKLDHARLWTYLFDIPKDKVPPPLQQFQHTEATKQDTFEMVRSINLQLGEKKLEEQRLKRLFSKSWAEFQKILQQLPASTVSQPPPRPVAEVLSELVEYVKTQTHEIQRLGDVVLKNGVLPGRKAAPRWSVKYALVGFKDKRPIDEILQVARQRGFAARRMLREGRPIAKINGPFTEYALGELETILKLNVEDVDISVDVSSVSVHRTLRTESIPSESELPVDCRA